MIHFACPKCRACYQAANDRQGEKLFCSRCGQKLQVPVPAQKTVLGDVIDPAVPGAVPFVTPALPALTVRLIVDGLRLSEFSTDRQSEQVRRAVGEMLAKLGLDCDPRGAISGPLFYQFSWAYQAMADGSARAAQGKDEFLVDLSLQFNATGIAIFLLIFFLPIGLALYLMQPQLQQQARREVDQAFTRLRSELGA